MDATNEGNSFHFGVNFKEALEDEAASSQELGEDLNNIVKESNVLYKKSALLLYLYCSFL